MAINEGAWVQANNINNEGRLMHARYMGDMVHWPCSRQSDDCRAELPFNFRQAL